jgi:hypothetical protein
MIRVDVWIHIRLSSSINTCENFHTTERKAAELTRDRISISWLLVSSSNVTAPSSGVGDQPMSRIPRRKAYKPRTFIRMERDTIWLTSLNSTSPSLHSLSHEHTSTL